MGRLGHDNIHSFSINMNSDLEEECEVSGMKDVIIQFLIDKTHFVTNVEV